MSNGQTAGPAKIKRVVIMGSKPHSIVPSGDIIYCANAAALTDPVAVSKFPRRTVVASGQVVARGINSNSLAQTFDEVRAQSVCNFDGQEAVIFLNEGDYRFRLLNDELIRIGPPSRTIRFIDARGHRALVGRFVGAYPLLDRRFFKQPVRVILLDSIKIAICSLSWIWGSRRLDVSAKYRPSTGILALLLAIRDHGIQTQYILSGIGLGNRDAHILDGKPFEVKRAPRRDLPLHVVADIIVLQRLAKRFDIRTTEVELEGILPIVKF
jgi:hypothetical protein